MTTLFGSTAVIAIPTPKKKHSLLPVLTVLFLVSYAMMTLLIIEQDSVIQTQRNLITVLMTDSKELWGLKGKAISDKQMAKSRAAGTAQAPSTQAPSTQAPSNQTPTNQAPSKQAPGAKAPSTQGLHQQHAPGRAGKMARPEAQRPPAPAADLNDQRRELHSI